MLDNKLEGSPEVMGNSAAAHAQPLRNNDQSNGNSAIPAPIVQENPVRQIRHLLGYDVVLLPIAAGEKAPRFNGWNATTIERMGDPAYLAQFTNSNIGVLLGQGVREPLLH
jgi:hypothetical protein